MTLGERFEGVVDAARAGADWAWSAIYRDLAPAVRGYVAARGAPEPDDATAEVFLQMVRDLGRFSGDERAFRAWVFVIAHHRVLDQVRTKKRKDALPVPQDAIATAATSGNVEDEALSALAREGVRRIIATLSADQQDVLLLRIIGGFTLAEVAHIVGKRQGAVKALQRRGLAELQKRLS